MSKPLPVGQAIAFRGLRPHRATLILLAVPLLAQNPASVWITAPDSRVVAGASMPLTVVPRDANGRILNVNCSWSVNAGNPFTVEAGVATARTLGIGDITAQCGNTRNTIRLQSVPKEIAVTPGDSDISVGDGITYTARVLDANNTPIADVPLSWNVIGEDGNNTASVFINPRGQLSSVGVGRFTVRATYAYNAPPPGQPGPGSGQFIQQFYGRARVTVRPPKAYKLTRLASTAERREAFQLRPRRSQISVNSSGQIAFNASLEGYATGLFVHDGQPRMLAAAGFPGDVPGTMVWDFDEPSINSRGDIFASLAYWGAGPGLVWVKPGEPPLHMFQDGSTSFDIRNVFASRFALNDSGQAIFRGTFLPFGERVRATGLFSTTVDGAIDLLVDTTQTLDGIESGWSFTNEFSTDNALNVAFTVTRNGVQTLYRRDERGVIRRIAGPGDRIDGRDVRTVGSPVLAPESGDMGFIINFTTSPSRLVLCRKGDCSQPRTFEANDVRALYAIRNSVVFYGNAGEGAGIHVWDGNSPPRSVFLEGKLSPSGPVFTAFQSAGITASGDVFAQARTSSNLFVIVRASGTRRSTVLQSGEFVNGLAGPAFANLAIGAKVGPAHLLVGGGRNNIFEASPSGVFPRLLAGDRLPSGGWFEATYSVRKTPQGDIFAVTDESLHLVTADSVRLLKTFPTILDGVNTFSPVLFTGNSSGLVAALNNTGSSVQRLMMMQSGEWRHIAWIGSNNAALRTASPTGGNFDGINDMWLMEDGILLASMRVNGGRAGLFLYDGQWRPIALIDDTIDSRRLQNINDFHVGGTHIFARFQLANRNGIYEYAGGEWRKVIAQSDDSPTGNILNSVGVFDVNSKGQVAARIDSGGVPQVVLIDGSSIRVVHDFNQIADSGDWLRDPLAIDLRDDGRIFFTIRSYTDQFTLYEADPLP